VYFAVRRMNLMNFRSAIVLLTVSNLLSSSFASCPPLDGDDDRLQFFLDMIESRRDLTTEKRQELCGHISKLNGISDKSSSDWSEEIRNLRQSLREIVEPEIKQMIERVCEITLKEPVWENMLDFPTGDEVILKGEMKDEFCTAIDNAIQYGDDPSIDHIRGAILGQRVAAEIAKVCGEGFDTLNEVMKLNLAFFNIGPLIDDSVDEREEICRHIRYASQAPSGEAQLGHVLSIKPRIRKELKFERYRKFVNKEHCELVQVSTQMDEWVTETVAELLEPSSDLTIDERSNLCKEIEIFNRELFVDPNAPMHGKLNGILDSLSVMVHKRREEKHMNPVVISEKQDAIAEQTHRLQQEQPAIPPKSPPTMKSQAGINPHQFHEGKKKFFSGLPNLGIMDWLRGRNEGTTQPSAQPPASIRDRLNSFMKKFSRTSK